MKAEGLEKVILCTRKEVQLFHLEKTCFMYFILFLIENIKLFTTQPTLHVLETQVFPDKKFFFFLNRKKYQIWTEQENTTALF